MRAAFILTVFAGLAIVLLLHAALRWARRGQVRKYPDGMLVKLYGDDYIVLWAYQHRGRWWYHLDGLPFDVKQEDLE